MEKSKLQKYAEGLAMELKNQYIGEIIEELEPNKKAELIIDFVIEDRGTKIGNKFQWFVNNQELTEQELFIYDNDKTSKNDCKFIHAYDMIKPELRKICV